MKEVQKAKQKESCRFRTLVSPRKWNSPNVKSSQVIHALLIYLQGGREGSSKQIQDFCEQLEENFPDWAIHEIMQVLQAE